MVLVVMAVLVGACGGSSPSQSLPTVPPTWTPSQQTIKATPTETLEERLTPTPAPTKKATAKPMPTATYTPIPTATPTPRFSEKDIQDYTIVKVYFLQEGKDIIPTNEQVQILYHRLYGNDQEFLDFMKETNEHIEDYLNVVIQGHPYEFKTIAPGIRAIHFTDVDETYNLVFGPKKQIGTDFHEAGVSYTILSSKLVERK